MAAIIELEVGVRAEPATEGHGKHEFGKPWACQWPEKALSVTVKQSCQACRIAMYAEAVVHPELMFQVMYHDGLRQVHAFVIAMHSARDNDPVMLPILARAFKDRGIDVDEFVSALSRENDDRAT